MTPIELKDLWNVILGRFLPKVMALPQKRQIKCKARLKDYTDTEWEQIFLKIAKTPFLLGQNNTGWTASFDWIINNEENALKVLEGNYERKTDVNFKIKEISDKERREDRIRKGFSPCCGAKTFTDEDDHFARCCSCLREVPNVPAIS